MINMNKMIRDVDISIIVPIYNAEKYIKKCIDSLIKQTKKNIEFILINDGSTDNSEEIIKKFDDFRLHYYKNKNQGIGKSRNFGIKKAVGKYIMFLDSDDYLPYDACEKFYEHAISTNSDLVVSDYYKDKLGEIEYFNIPSFKSSSVHDNNELILKINLGPCNKLYSRDMLTKNKILFNEKYKYEDAPFVISCIINAKKISKIDLALYYYVIHENSETTVRDDRVFDILKIVDLIRLELQSHEILTENIDKLIVSIITNYNLQQRYQVNKKIRNTFIDESFSYLKNNVPNYRNKKYYNGKNFLRRFIEKNKIITKVYCTVSGIKYRR